MSNTFKNGNGGSGRKEDAIILKKAKKSKEFIKELTSRRQPDKSGELANLINKLNITKEGVLDKQKKISGEISAIEEINLSKVGLEKQEIINQVVEKTKIEAQGVIKEALAKLSDISDIKEGDDFPDVEEMIKVMFADGEKNTGVNEKVIVEKIAETIENTTKKNTEESGQKIIRTKRLLNDEIKNEENLILKQKNILNTINNEDNLTPGEKKDKIASINKIIGASRNKIYELKQQVVISKEKFKDSEQADQLVKIMAGSKKPLIINKFIPVEQNKSETSELLEQQIVEKNDKFFEYYQKSIESLKDKSEMFEKANDEEKKKIAEEIIKQAGEVLERIEEMPAENNQLKNIYYKIAEILRGKIELYKNFLEISNTEDIKITEKPVKVVIKNREKYKIIPRKNNEPLVKQTLVDKTKLDPGFGEMEKIDYLKIANKDYNKKLVEINSNKEMSEEVKMVLIEKIEIDKENFENKIKNYNQTNEADVKSLSCDTEYEKFKGFIDQDIVKVKDRYIQQLKKFEKKILDEGWHSLEDINRKTKWFKNNISILEKYIGEPNFSKESPNTEKIKVPTKIINKILIENNNIGI